MSKKEDFSKFRIGTVFNKLNQTLQNIQLKKDQAVIIFPSRLNAMAIDSSKIASNDNLIYTPGEVVFSVNLCKKISVKVLFDTSEIKINEQTKRPSLAMHAGLLMQKTLGVNHGYEISIENNKEIRHAGLGSSSSLISGVMACINELYGNPISAQNLVKYSAQNHGEEIDNDDESLIPVQCIGGSAASGLFEGFVLILAGESEVVANIALDAEYKVLIGIPKDYIPKDSEELMKLEELNFDKFIKTGLEHGDKIAYSMFHKVLPELKHNQIKSLGDLIYDYRFRMGSINNCSFVYDDMIKIGKILETIKNNGLAEVLSLSSVGPAFFVITKNITECRDIFEQANLDCIETELFNTTYIVQK